MSGEGTGPMMDGPNTHHYRTFTRGTTFVVISIDYADGGRHTFHVPAEVVHDIEAREHREPPPDALDGLPRYTPRCAPDAPPMVEDPLGNWVVLRDARAALQAAPEPPGDVSRGPGRE